MMWMRPRRVSSSPKTRSLPNSPCSGATLDKPCRGSVVVPDQRRISGVAAASCRLREHFAHQVALDADAVLPGQHAANLHAKFLGSKAELIRCCRAPGLLASNRISRVQVACSRMDQGRATAAGVATSRMDIGLGSRYRGGWCRCRCNPPPDGGKGRFAFGPGSRDLGDEAELGRRSARRSRSRDRSDNRRPATGPSNFPIKSASASVGYPASTKDSSTASMASLSIQGPSRTDNDIGHGRPPDAVSGKPISRAGGGGVCTWSTPSLPPMVAGI